MCPFCGINGQAHRPDYDPENPPALISLQLSQAAYDAQHRKDERRTMDLTSDDSSKIRVVALSDDAKRALKAASPEGEDWIETRFSMFDSMLWVMQRLEKVLRYVMKFTFKKPFLLKYIFGGLESQWRTG